jgi:hypothetical protein
MKPMSLLKKRRSKKPTVSEYRKAERLRNLAGTTQNTIRYASLFKNGLMHIVNNEYSQMYTLGDLDYEVATEEERTNVLTSYIMALNSLDKDSSFQLVVTTRKMGHEAVDQVVMPMQNDAYDEYRRERNKIIADRFDEDEEAIEINKYLILSTLARDEKAAKFNLNKLVTNFGEEFNNGTNRLAINSLTGEQRLEQLRALLRPAQNIPINFDNIELLDMKTKDFVAPGYLKLREKYFEIDDKFATILYVRQYPTWLEDRLIRRLTSSNRELVISLHARPYDVMKAQKAVNNAKTMNQANIIKQQKDNFKQGLSEDMISSYAKDVREASDQMSDDLRSGNQKLFSGIFTVMITEDSLEHLQEAVTDIKAIGETESVVFDEAFRFQEEGLNTVLPFGKPYLDVESTFMRDMLTDNIATQVPFTNVELRSPTGQYYGQNQLSHNAITIDRKRDGNTPSGLILGSSGSGKSVTTKWTMTDTLLSMNKTSDRMIIVDPESEYLKIGKAFGGEILDIATGTDNHLNLLDLADRNLLKDEDQNLNLQKDKANMLVGLFEQTLGGLDNPQKTLIERTTLETYRAFESSERVPTLVDWYQILQEQPEPIPGLYIKQELVIALEPYTVGAKNIFAYETNIDLTSRFIVFNLKNLDQNLKPFAMQVILDQIWRQVVANQNKFTTWLYFDELQSNFRNDEAADWFENLWARVRKYSAIPTGITQSVETLLEKSAGRKMIVNSEFMVLLRMKKGDLAKLQAAKDMPENLLKYVGENVKRGTGLISNDNVWVPFENDVPKDTKLYELMNTDRVTE